MTDTSELYRLMSDTPEIQKDHEWAIGEWRIYVPTGTIVCTTHADKWFGLDKGRNIFLPDIGWYLEHIEGAIQLNRDDSGFYLCNGLPRCDSPEIAILRLFMYANHGKTWDGKEWVKE